MANMLRVRIVTPEKTILNDEFNEAIIPTTAGEIGVLARHAPLVSGLKPGEIKLKSEKINISLAVSGGFIEVRPDSELIILADTAERAEEINLERAEKARQRAEQMLKEKTDAEDVEYVYLQARIEKEAARLRVGRKYRKLPPTK